MSRYPVIKIEWSEIDKAFIVYIDDSPVTHGDTIEDAIKYLSEVVYLNNRYMEEVFRLERRAKKLDYPPDIKDAATVEYVQKAQTDHMGDDHDKWLDSLVKKHKPKMDLEDQNEKFVLSCVLGIILVVITTICVIFN